MHCTNDILHYQTREVTDAGRDSLFCSGLIMAKSDDNDDDDVVIRLQEEKKYRVIILVR